MRGVIGEVEHEVLIGLYLLFNKASSRICKNIGKIVFLHINTFKVFQ